MSIENQLAELAGAHFVMPSDKVREVDLVVRDWGAEEVIRIALAGLPRTRAWQILDVVMGTSRHILDLGEDGWSLQHPLACRDDLLNCDVHRTMEAYVHEYGPPGSPLGRYYVTVSFSIDPDFELDPVVTVVSCAVVDAEAAKEEQVPDSRA
jgi:hypothetical protein